MTDAPFTKVPNIVIKAVIDKQISQSAGWLYTVLASHLNGKRGDATVWPSRQTLAAEMGMSKPAAVDRYLTELIDVGLVVKTKTSIGGMQARNRYRLTQTISVRSPHLGTTEPPAETPGRPSSQRSPRLGTTLFPNEDYVVPRRGQELDEDEPDEDELSLRRRAAPSSSSSAHSAKKTKPARSKDDDLRIALALVAEHAGCTEGTAADVIAWWRHVGRVRFPGRYAQAIIDRDGQGQLTEVAAQILDGDADVNSIRIMEELPLEDTVDSNTVESWIIYALTDQVPYVSLLPTVFALAADGTADTEAYIEAIERLCSPAAA